MYVYIYIIHSYREGDIHIGILQYLHPFASQLLHSPCGTTTADSEISEMEGVEMIGKTNMKVDQCVSLRAIKPISFFNFLVLPGAGQCPEGS